MIPGMQRIRPRGPIKAKLFVPLGVKRMNVILAWAKRNETTPEEALERSLMDLTLKQLQLNHYTSADVEMVRKKDDLEGQVKEWVGKSMRMLSFGQGGGVYKTLVFEVSPRMLEEEVL